MRLSLKSQPSLKWIHISCFQFPLQRFKFNKKSSTSTRSSKMSAEDISKLQTLISQAKYPIVLTGAGISAESGIPTFRGTGGLWRKFEATQLATPEAFAENPSRVWEFYEYRRRLVSKCKPNKGHYAITAFEKMLKDQDKDFTLITQNVDRLHHAAATKNIIEIHGSLWVTRCMTCKKELENRDIPICKSLHGKGDPGESDANISESDLPRCECGGLLRPAVVWFNEKLNSQIIDQALQAMEYCDLLIVVGTSAVVYPAAMWAPMVARRGAPVVEFNLERTANSDINKLKFLGKAGELLPKALGVEIQVEELWNLHQQVKEELLSESKEVPEVKNENV